MELPILFSMYKLFKLSTILKWVIGTLPCLKYDIRSPVGDSGEKISAGTHGWLSLKWCTAVENIGWMKTNETRDMIQDGASLK